MAKKKATKKIAQATAKKTTKKTTKETTKKAAKKIAAPKTKKAAKKVKTVKAAKTSAKMPAKKSTAPAKAQIASSYGLKLGDHVPKFDAPTTSGGQVSSESLTGQISVLYFYPKDNTPGCTLEGQDFRRLNNEFKKLGCVIYGVSQDSLKSHESFKAKCDFPFELIADESGELCRGFDVIQMKSMYGRQYEGIERSTFVIDAEGRVHHEWRKVKVEGHAQEVLDVVKGMA